MKIKEIEIFTPKLIQQTKFYAEVLELDILEKTEHYVSFQIGNSILKLTSRTDFTPYHFAINIPSNQENEALNWLKKRVKIIKNEDLEIQYFDFWDAHAIYFYDEDGNILEFIARRTLNKESNQPFDKNSLLEICEIGIPTTDVKRDFEILNKTTGIPIKSGNVERFCAAGDDEGLFIIINKNLKKEWFPTNDAPFSSDFNIRFFEKGEEYFFEYKNERLRNLSQKC